MQYIVCCLPDCQRTVCGPLICRFTCRVYISLKHNPCATNLVASFKAIAWLPAHQVGPTLRLEAVILENQAALLDFSLEPCAMDFSRQIPDEASVYSPSDSPFCLVSSLMILHFIIAQPAAVAASNPYVPKQFSLVCKLEVQQCLLVSAPQSSALWKLSWIHAKTSWLLSFNPPHDGQCL